LKAIRFSEEQYQGLLKRNAKALSAWAPAPKTHKFHAEKTDGYDSKSEARRADELRLLEKNGAIANLKEQVPFVLIDEQRDASGALLERASTLIVDFCYEQDGELVCEDVKGMRAGTAYAIFVLKRKLLLLRHGIRIRETGRRR
jgi:hypothetical protein